MAEAINNFLMTMVASNGEHVSQIEKSDTSDKCAEWMDTLKCEDRRPTFEESLTDARNIVVAFLRNEFEQSMAVATRWANINLNYAVVKSMMLFIYGISTLEPDAIQSALQELNNLYAICETKRKKTSWSNTFSTLFWRPEYDEYTDEEIHAELVHGEYQLMAGTLLLLEEPSFMVIVKSAFKLKNGYQKYKECQFIMQNRTKWTSQLAKENFETGVRIGWGFANLILSHLPHRVISLIQLVGFSCSREEGHLHLRELTKVTTSFRYYFGSLLIAAFNLSAEQMFGLGEGDLKLVDKVLTEMKKSIDKGSFVMFFEGKLKQMQGHIAESIELHEECIKHQKEWKQVHYVCYWELSWSYGLLRNWEKAAHYANLMLTECNWSPCINRSQYASFLYMTMESEKRDNLKPLIDESMRRVPEKRHRVAGKTLPQEKFAIRQSQQYFENEGRLVLPALENFYFYNFFNSVTTRKDVLDEFLAMIDRKIPEFDSVWESDNSPLDDVGLLYMLRGVCLKCNQVYSEAIECFKKVVECGPRMEKDSYIPPHAALELGICYMKISDFETSKFWLNKAKNDYSGFIVEAVAHIRIHIASMRLRQMKAKTANGRKGS